VSYTPDPDWIILADAAKRLGCCKRFLCDLARRGELPWLDGYGRFPASAILALEARWESERRAGKTPITRGQGGGSAS